MKEAFTISLTGRYHFLLEVNWGFPTRMVYLYNDIQWRYTILVGNPRNTEAYWNRMKTGWLKKKGQFFSLFFLSFPSPVILHSLFQMWDAFPLALEPVAMLGQSGFECRAKIWCFWTLTGYRRSHTGKPRYQGLFTEAIQTITIVEALMTGDFFLQHSKTKSRKSILKNSEASQKAVLCLKVENLHPCGINVF